MCVGVSELIRRWLRYTESLDWKAVICDVHITITSLIDTVVTVIECRDTYDRGWGRVIRCTMESLHVFF